MNLIMAVEQKPSLYLRKLKKAASEDVIGFVSISQTERERDGDGGREKMSPSVVICSLGTMTMSVHPLSHTRAHTHMHTPLLLQ